jgi:dCTP deaminase
MIKNDIWIREMAMARRMITPFEPGLIREVDGHKALSFGTGSFGYDIRLSPNDFRVFRHIPGTVVDPKNFNPNNLEPAELFSDDSGDFFVIPGNSYGLGVAVERLSIPSNITTICMGKSTYARVGIIANVTPGEAMWQGHLTLEFSNSSPADCRIYANEGVVQLLFLEGEQCDVSYADRQGKYQDQPEMITFARA